MPTLAEKLNKILNPDYKKTVAKKKRVVKDNVQKEAVSIKKHLQYISVDVYSNELLLAHSAMQQIRLAVARNTVLRFIDNATQRDVSEYIHRIVEVRMGYKIDGAYKEDYNKARYRIGAYR